jgi:hypothetical protein
MPKIPFIEITDFQGKDTTILNHSKYQECGIGQHIALK